MTRTTEDTDVGTGTSSEATHSHRSLNLHNSYPFLLQGPTDSTSVRYSLFLSQKVGFTTFCIVIAALTLMHNHLVLSLVGRHELCRIDNKKNGKGLFKKNQNSIAGF